MATQQQIAANRLNAQHSSGPKTEAGRNRSRMNGVRHGLTGQVTTMTDEDRAAHEQFSKALMKDLAPDGAMEIQLARRVFTLESKQLQLLTRYEQRVNRSLQNNVPPAKRNTNSPYKEAALKRSEMKGLEHFQ
jgi:hypothetical protein